MAGISVGGAGRGGAGAADMAADGLRQVTRRNDQWIERGARLGYAAKGAIYLVIGGLAIGTGLIPLRPDSPQRVAFAQVVPSSITAVADLVPGRDGTQIKVECVYAEVNDPRPGGAHDTYSIFVVDRAGHSSEIKEWPATPNKQMRPSGMTPLQLSQIADLEIRESNTNEVLLRAPLR